MFTVTNLVDRNLQDDVQTVNINDMTMVHKEPDGNETVYSLKRIDLIEPQKGRIFIKGDVYVPGMLFKKVMPSGDSGIVSEIIGPKNKVIKSVYVVV